MRNKLEDVDYIVVISIVLISIISGLIQYLTSVNVVVEYLEIVGPLAMLVSILILYQIAKNTKTETGRHIKVIGIGAAFFALGWTHRLANRTLDLEGMGVPLDFTNAFFIVLAIGGIITMTYGFYMVKEDSNLQGQKQ